MPPGLRIAAFALLILCACVQPSASAPTPVAPRTAVKSVDSPAPPVAAATPTVPPTPYQWCSPAPPVPDGARGLACAHGNFDGASPSERIYTYTPDGHSFTAVVELADGSSTSVRVAGAFGLPADGGVTGVGDFDRDGRDEALVMLVFGASGGTAVLLKLTADRHLHVVSTPAGRLEIRLAAKAIENSDARCYINSLGRPILALQTINLDGAVRPGMWDWQQDLYAWAGADVIRVGGFTGSAPLGDPPRVPHLPLPGPEFGCIGNDWTRGA